jgi:hypothetical protein
VETAVLVQEEHPRAYRDCSVCLGAVLSERLGTQLTASEITTATVSKCVNLGALLKFLIERTSLVFISAG